MLIATGNGLTWPSTVGFSINRALPPPADFISLSASSVISSSVATGVLMRLSSPDFSKARQSPDSRKMPYQDADTGFAVGAERGLDRKRLRNSARSQILTPRKISLQARRFGSKPLSNVLPSKFLAP